MCIIALCLLYQSFKHVIIFSTYWSSKIQNKTAVKILRDIENIYCEVNSVCTLTWFSWKKKQSLKKTQSPRVPARVRKSCRDLCDQWEAELELMSDTQMCKRVLKTELSITVKQGQIDINTRSWVYNLWTTRSSKMGKQLYYYELLLSMRDNFLMCNINNI